MTSILYQNISHTVALLDLPKSISDASGVYSVNPVRPNQPFPSTEPKGPKHAKLKSSIPQDEQRYHEQILDLVTAAMKEVHQYMGQAKWYLQPPASCVKEHSSGGTIEGAESAKDGVACTIERHEGGTTGEYGRLNELEPGLLIPPVVLSTLTNHYDAIAALQDTLVFNPSTVVVRIDVSKCSFLVPPRSVFLLSRIQQGLAIFKTASRASGGLFSAISLCEFDFILLDPPWPNRSVRKAKVYNTYEQQPELHPFLQALPIISRHLRPSGIAAVWITNKRAIRETVLCSLREMHLDLHEEWIWLKTTSCGEPVTAVDGLWRKPYEVLLLFSRKLAVHDGPQERPRYPEVKRRVIIAVPDIHSRKPCLKELLKTLMPENYRALEIFARGLTAGWCSWGDEVLKFNKEGA